MIFILFLPILYHYLFPGAAEGELLAFADVEFFDYISGDDDTKAALAHAGDFSGVFFHSFSMLRNMLRSNTFCVHNTVMKVSIVTTN